MKRIVMAVLVAGMFGCGSDGGGGGGAFSCDVNVAGTHTCTLATYGSGVTQASIDSGKSACTQGGGTAGSACPSGQVGVCTTTASAGANSYTSAAYYYTGMAAALMTACTTASGTWK